MALDVSGERGIGLGRFAVGTGSSVVGGSGSGRGGGSGTLAQVVQGWDLSPSAGLGTRAVNGHGRGSGRGKGEDVVVFGGYDVARAWPETEDADGRMPRDDDDDEEARRRPGGVRRYVVFFHFPLSTFRFPLSHTPHPPTLPHERAYARSCLRAVSPHPFRLRRASHEIARSSAFCSALTPSPMILFSP